MSSKRAASDELGSETCAVSLCSSADLEHCLTQASDTLQQAGGEGGSTSCDGSDCAVCHCCSTLTGGRTGASKPPLSKRMSSRAQQQREQQLGGSHACSSPPHSRQHRRSASRLRRDHGSSNTLASTSTDLLPLSQESLQQQAPSAAQSPRQANAAAQSTSYGSSYDSLGQPCAGSGSSVCVQPWAWQTGWAARTQPVPAVMLEAAAFQPRESMALQRRHHADIICGVDFSPEGSLLASAGVAKQVRIYSLASFQSSEVGVHQLPIALHRMPSKLSSVAWSPDMEGVVTVGDYDGVVSQLHVESGHLLADADEHAGRRIWSVQHSTMRPFLCMSASDDGTSRLWSGYGLVQRAGIIRPPGNPAVCCAEFCRTDENLLALACSDCTAYVYDLRNLQEPLVMLQSHERAVAFVRFISRHSVVTSSVDAMLAWWDICASPSASQQDIAGTQAGIPRQLPSQWYRGHQNSKNFVGLSVREDGLMACGSESHEVFAYHTCWSNPLATRSLTPQPIAHLAPQMSSPCAGEFVSAVSWRSMDAVDLGTGPLLAAATSDGAVKVLSLETICQGGSLTAFSDSG